jgi:hypothetical protein
MPDEVAPDYVRARWAYSELLSWGHGHLYQGPGVHDLKQKLALGVPFDELGKAEHYLLIDQFDRVRGNYINRYIIGIPSFKRVLWSSYPLFRAGRFEPPTPKGHLQAVDCGRSGQASSPGSCPLCRVRRGPPDTG